MKFTIVPAGTSIDDPSNTKVNGTEEFAMGIASDEAGEYQVDHTVHTIDGHLIATVTA